MTDLTVATEDRKTRGAYVSGMMNMRLNLDRDLYFI